MHLVLEITATFLNLLFIVLLIRENVWCWIFGIIGSLLSIWLFVSVKLYAEAFLFVFYVAIGIYGWVQWAGNLKEPLITISEMAASDKTLLLLIGVLSGIVGGDLLDRYTDAQKPWVDAQTTVFSFIASYLEAKKILFGWVLWIGINGTSIWLYSSRGLHIYAGLAAVFFVLSLVGWMRWKANFNKVRLP